MPTTCALQREVLCAGSPHSAAVAASGTLGVARGQTASDDDRFKEEAIAGSTGATALRDPAASHSATLRALDEACRLGDLAVAPCGGGDAFIVLAAWSVDGT